MIILLGSNSDQKINILKNVIPNEWQADIISITVNSEITEQPLNLETTINGARNRAKNAIKKYKGHFNISVGMEAGLVLIDKRYALICTVIVLDKNNNEFIGLSSKLPLPKIVSDAILGGGLFGVMVREYKQKLAEENQENIMVDKLINRTELFTEAIRNALEQYKSAL